MTSSIKGMQTGVSFAQHPVDWVSLNICTFAGIPDTYDLFRMRVCACLCLTDKKVENSNPQTCNSSGLDVANKINRTRWIKLPFALFPLPFVHEKHWNGCQIIENWHPSPFPSGHRRISHQDSGRWGFMEVPGETPCYAGVKAELRDTRYWSEPN